MPTVIDLHQSSLHVDFVIGSLMSLAALVRCYPADGDEIARFLELYPQHAAESTADRLTNPPGQVNIRSGDTEALRVLLDGNYAVQGMFGLLGLFLVPGEPLHLVAVRSHASKTHETSRRASADALAGGAFAGLRTLRPRRPMPNAGPVHHTADLAA